MNFIAVMRTAAAVLSLAICLTAAKPAFAQEPSAASMALAKEMVVLKGVNQMLDPVVPGVIESGKNMFLQTNPQLSKDLNDVAANLRKEFDPKREEITNIMARAYAQKFTEAELKDMLVFFKTPLGKKIITDEPQIIQQAMSSVQVWANSFSEQMISRIRADMKKKGHDL
jgi:hypothetical protein